MKMKTTILSVSINPTAGYALEEIANMGYDMAKDFFLNHDEINACAVREYTINTEHPHESKFYADGFQNGDGSDSMIVWIKVEPDTTNWL